MGGPHGQNSGWAMAHTAHPVPAPMLGMRPPRPPELTLMLISDVDYANVI